MRVKSQSKVAKVARPSLLGRPKVEMVVTKSLESRHNVITKSRNQVARRSGRPKMLSLLCQEVVEGLRQSRWGSKIVKSL